MIVPTYFLMCLVYLFVHKSTASCRVSLVRSIHGEHRNIYDRYGNNRGCCRFVYPVLNSSAKCSYISLAKGQHFEPFVIEGKSEDNDDYFEVIPGFNHLSFELSRVPTISVSLFANFTNITHLYMNATHVEEIQQGGFNGLGKLKVLELANNKLTEISRGILNHLTNLQILNASHNHIDLIESNAFMGLLNLEELILSYNNIKVLHPNTFPHFQFILVIDLSHNMIIELPESAFQNNSQYQDDLFDPMKLDLSHNNIQSINTTYIPIPLISLSLYNNNLTEFEFLNLDFLHYLSLGSNNLSNISEVYELLTYLDLSRNRICDLDPQLLKESKFLTVLDLSSNFIQKLPDDIFISLTVLRNLSLDNNKLEHIPIGCFHSLSALQFLNVSGNRISEFDYGTFSGLSSLITLDISNNTLTYLYETTFHPLLALESLRLDHNFITTFDPYYFTEHLKVLNNVSLNFNLWNCKSLLNIFTALKSKSVKVFYGEEKRLLNIHGIACTKQNVESLVGTKSPQSEINDDIQGNYFNALFNENFINSKFYQFFKDFSNSHFEEERFLNEFTKTFSKILNEYKNSMPNTSVIQQLNDTLSKFIVEFKSLPNKLDNYSARDWNQLRQDIYRYFTVELKNITSQKLASKESDSSTLPQINVLKQFLNADFKNSFFYKFFQNNDFSKFSASDQISAPKYEKYVGGDDPVITKISSLQNGLNTLLAIILIVLCCLLALFLIKSFDNPLKKFNTRNVVGMPTDSHATLELI
uniref:LRRCT domain-containing protein n=1 Tax=Photinus pyralis TaxID=7054 RepID=A0A1Y1LTR4_PHOPY